MGQLSISKGSEEGSEVLSTEIPTVIIQMMDLSFTRSKLLVHDETYTRRRELSYLAFRLVFRAGAAIRNVARSVQATSAESELQ